jgi:hypothetical protein
MSVILKKVDDITIVDDAVKGVLPVFSKGGVINGK